MRGNPKLRTIEKRGQRYQERRRYQEDHSNIGSGEGGICRGKGLAGQLLCVIAGTGRTVGDLICYVARSRVELSYFRSCFVYISVQIRTHPRDVRGRGRGPGYPDTRCSLIQSIRVFIPFYSPP